MSCPISHIMVTKVPIKSCGDVFHQLFRDDPKNIPNISSDVRGCHLHEGQFGTAGSIVEWTYVDDGKERKAKEVIEEIDDEKRSITFKVLEGDLLELYTKFKLSFHVDTNGEDNLVTWTLYYEKHNEGGPDPITLRDYFIGLTKSIETHHLTKE